jgi:hypothetical protein
VAADPTRLWAFSSEGLGYCLEDGFVTRLSQRPLFDARPTAALRVGEHVIVATRAGVRVLDRALTAVGSLDLDGPVYALAGLEPLGALAFCHQRGGVVATPGAKPTVRRYDYWPDREPATAACPADAFTGAPDAVLWGTAEGRLYISYDDNSRRDEERIGGLISPHDGSIVALCADPAGGFYVATQGGGLWRADPEGGMELVDRRPDCTLALVRLERHVLAFEAGGAVLDVSGTSPKALVTYDAEITAVAAGAGLAFVGLADGSVACPFDADMRVPVANAPIDALAT